MQWEQRPSGTGMAEGAAQCRTWGGLTADGVWAVLTPFPGRAQSLIPAEIPPRRLPALLLERSFTNSS